MVTPSKTTRQQLAARQAVVHSRHGSCRSHRLIPKAPRVNDWLSQLTNQSGPQSNGLFLPVTFEQPLWLLLAVPLCVLVWWIARRNLSGFGTFRRHAHVVVRCVVVLLICGTLAEPQFRKRAEAVAVVAVMDVSDSVPREERKRAGDFLDASLARRPRADRFGVVASDRESRARSLPSEHPDSAGGSEGATAGGGSGDGSNLQKGVELAKGMIPADAAGRVLVISDGNQTAGDVQSAARTLRSAGVPIDVASVEYDRSAGVRVDDVIVPAWVRDEDTITVRVQLTAGKPATGRLTLLLDGAPLDLDASSPAFSARVALAGGPEVVALPVKLPSGPVHRFEAVFEPDDAGASVPELLRAEGVTFTSDRGHVLVLAEDASAAAVLVKAISSDNLRVEVRPAVAAPTTLADWTGYDAVALFDEPSTNFSQAQQADMARAVHEAGGGLLVIGGPNSYGAGGWIGSPLADALPVLLDPPSKRQMPMGALALIIDRSGSMDASVSGTGMTQQQIANEAALLAVRSLSRQDEVAVVTFSGDHKVDVPLTRCSNMGYIERAIHSIGPGGGTNLFPAIDAAADELVKSAAGVKHIIILTDGETIGDPNDGVSMAARVRASGITLSAVAIGDGSNVTLLRRLAKAGGGRLNAVRSEYSKALLPQILIKEAQTVRRSLIWEGPAFSPQLNFPTDALHGIAGPFPGISGYVVTGDRAGLSIVELRGPEGDPILAQWQHGLGRVTAYTSDAATRWNPAWPGWSSFSAFWQQHVKWVMRPSGDPNARVTVDTRGDSSRVMLELLDSSGQPVNFAAIRARLVPPAGEASAGGTPRDVAFRQVGPGRYQADADTKAVGSHLLSLRYDAGEKRTGSVRTAIVRRSGEEFREPKPNLTLLWELAKITGGHVYQLDGTGADLWIRERLRMPELARPIWLLVAAIGLFAFVLDVAARRITIDPARIGKWMMRIASAAPEKSSVAVSSLMVARGRTAGSLERSTDHLQADQSRSAASAPESVVVPNHPAPPRPPSSSTVHAPARPAAKVIPVNEEERMSRLRAAKMRRQQGHDASDEQDASGTPSDPGS